MNRLFLTLFLAAELTFYLLVAQTGIVEYFHSNFSAFFTLPIGGIIGSVITYYLRYPVKNKILLFLSMQFGVALMYPDINLFFLLFLGVSVGAMAPLFIYLFREKNFIQMLIALAISYASGTLLFSYPAGERGLLAVGLTLIALVSILFFKEVQNEKTAAIPFSWSMIFIMTTWVYLDSTLFETLSRSHIMHIWGSAQFTSNIVIFHLLGVVGGYFITQNKMVSNLLIWMLFGISYSAYWLQMDLLLSMSYPFVISLYNVVILRHLIGFGSLKELGTAMLFIGWAASGAGLISALLGITTLAGFIIIAVYTAYLMQQLISQQRIQYV